MSNRLTFSLASLIVLIVFGLVFGTNSVMAHSEAQRDTNNDGVLDVGMHDHPVLVAVTADSSATPPVLGIPTHNEHPMVKSIMLQAGANVEGDIIALDGTANTDAVLVLTFDQGVVNANNLTNFDGNAADDLLPGEISVGFLNAADNTVITTSSTTVARVTDSDSAFTITLTPGSYPTADQEFSLRISVNNSAVFSLQTAELVPGMVLPDNIPGGANPASMIYSFRVFDSLGSAPMLSGPTTAQGPGPVTLTFMNSSATGITSWMWTDTPDPGLEDSYSYDPTDDPTDGTEITLLPATDMDIPAGTIKFTAEAMDALGNVVEKGEVVVTVEARRYHPAPSFLSSQIDLIRIWSGSVYSSDLLPKARAPEGVDLLYKIRPEGGMAGDPHMPPAGFELVANDIQDRYLVATNPPTLAKTTYEYIAYNVASPMMESMPIKFSIEVIDPVVPGPPTNVMAEEVGHMDDPVDREINDNRVKVAWDEPEDNNTYGEDSVPYTEVGPSAIPFGSRVSRYEVTQTHPVGMVMRVYGDVDLPDDPMYPMDNDAIPASPFNTPYPLASTRMSTPDLGEYTYDVIAVNGVGDSAKSNEAMALVLNPPNQPEDLRDARSGTNPGSVVLNWLKPTNEGDADGGLDDNLITSYLIIVIDPDGNRDEIDSDSDELEYQVEDLEHGRHVFRVAGINSDDVGSESISTAFDVTLPEPPTTAPNNAPVFADDAAIANIVATVGERVSGRFLPEATDADGDTLTYSVSPDLPAGLSFDPMNRALTGTPTAASEEMAYTYKVTDGNGGMDTIGFFVTVNATAVGPPPTSTPTDVLPAGGYIVYVRDENNPPHFGTSNPMIEEWSDMPNLYTLFAENGGGSLQLNVMGVTARQVVFSEVMWAVDEGQVGQDGYDANQWIEVHNRTANAISTTSISFAVKDGRPALAQGTDLVSNVVGGGNAWIRTKGQNGNSGAADGSGQKEFISMYRNNYGEAGWDGGRWSASSQVYHPNFKGTPGMGEPTGPKIITASGVRLDVVFNEIANYPSGNSSHEWIELRHVKGDKPNFENWVVDMVTGVNQQTRLFTIPKIDTGRYDDILLITKTDPARDDDHPLRGGYDVSRDFGQQDNEGRDKNIRYYVASDWNTDLPDGGEFVLILRHGNDKTNHEKVEDLAGYHSNLKVDDANTFTNLWPLVGYAAPNLSNNKIAVGEVDRRDYADIPGTKTKDGNNIDKVAFRSDNNDWTGIGYKRNAAAIDQNGGTPGYPNNALQHHESQAGADPVIISEIMYATGDRGNIPQWIELRNMSQTVGINLNGWQVTIVNHDQDNAAGDTYAGDLVKSYGINGKIPPGQTFLIVAHSGTDNTNLPSERVYAIRSRRGELILSQYGFKITVETAGATRKVADTFSNLGTPAADNRVRGNAESYVDPAWMLPAGMNMDGDRVSIVRVSTSDGAALNGLNPGAWKSFDMSAQINAPESTYYGNRNDLSSPGYTVDGVLPVSLSKFRPERLDTGETVVRWVTESETNNAGFNILRGEAIDGEFTKLNTKLIAGQGTTSEKTAYEFVDKTAKPNVVYYYQIQDVSLDGQVQTLRTTHLRGNVSAAGKLTTTWGELKALQ